MLGIASISTSTSALMFDRGSVTNGEDDSEFRLEVVHNDFQIKRDGLDTNKKVICLSQKRDLNYSTLSLKL